MSTRLVRAPPALPAPAAQRHLPRYGTRLLIRRGRQLPPDL